MIKPQFVEISFTIPFYELYFGENWDRPNPTKNPADLKALAKQMGVILDKELLFQIYDNAKVATGHEYFFYKSGQKEIFIYFNLYKDPTDQMAAVNMGVRQYSSRFKSTIKLLEKIYFNSPTRSPFSIDYFNQNL